MRKRTYNACPGWLGPPGQARSLLAGMLLLNDSPKMGREILFRE